MSNAGDRGAGIGDRDDRLDVAIDRAVREMLDVEPPAGLRGRVLDRLDAFSPNPVVSAFRRNVWWIAGPIAAAAILVVAVLVPWRHSAPAVVTPAAPSMAKAETPRTVPPAVSPRTSEPPRTVSLPRASSAPGHQPIARLIDDRMIAAAVAPADDTSGIDPLSPIVPIAVAASQPRDIAPKQIAISPLTPITELQIAPLSPPDRRN
jgi:hypothetical protein